MKIRSFYAASLGLTAICGGIILPLPLYAQVAQKVTADTVTYATLLQNFENMPRVEQLRALEDAAKARVNYARTRANPQISLDVENILGSSPYKGFDSAETTLQVSQDLELYGRRKARTQIADSLAQASKFEIAVKKSEYSRDLAQKYLALEYADLSLGLANDKVAAAKSDLNIVSLLQQGGREPLLRKIQAQNDLVRAEAELNNAAINFDAAKAELKLISLYDGNIGHFRTELINIEPDFKPFDITENPQYRLLNAQKSASQYSLDASRIETKPDASAYLGVRHYADERAMGFVGGISVSVPLGTKARAAIEEKSAQLRADNYAINAFIRDTEGQRQVYIQKINALSGAIVRTQKLIASARDNYELVTLGFKSGKILLPEVQSAREQLFAAQNELITQKYNRALLLSELSFLEGRTLTTKYAGINNEN